MTRGVIYVARGAEHVAAARHSAASVKRHMPDLPTCIWCGAGDDTAGFDMARAIPDGLTRPKVDLLPESPFEQTLYLDNDTLVTGPLDGAFRLLERFEMTGAQVVLWHRPRHSRRWREDVPEAFPEINCGVLLYRRTPAVVDFFRAWSRNYAEAGIKPDQVTFRELLWRSDLRFAVLPPQFNKRVFEGSEVIYTDQPPPRIVHLPILRPQKSALKRALARLVRRRFSR